MTAQPATQTTCGECRVIHVGERREAADTERAIRPFVLRSQYAIAPCPLHAQAEATAKERDALLEQLIVAEVIISNVSLFKDFRGAWDEETLPAIRAAIAAAKNVAADASGKGLKALLGDALARDSDLANDLAKDESDGGLGVNELP